MFLFVKWMLTVFYFRERSLALNNDRQAVKQATALSDVTVYSPNHAHTKHTHARQTHTNPICGTHTHTHTQQQTAGPCLRSRRSMDLQRGESKRFEAYVKSLWIQNKALSRMLCLGQAACSLLCCALHAAGDTILQVQDETHHHPFTSSCSLPLQTVVDFVCSAPI